MSVTGWKLEEWQRAELLDRLPPLWPDVIADHVTLNAKAGDKDPLLGEIEASKAALLEKKFPVSYRLIKEAGKEYLDAPTFAELLVWLDSLDRI